MHSCYICGESNGYHYYSVAYSSEEVQAYNDMNVCNDCGRKFCHNHFENGKCDECKTTSHNDQMVKFLISVSEKIKDELIEAYKSRDKNNYLYYLISNNYDLEAKVEDLYYDE